MRAGVPRFLLCSVALAAAGCGGSNPASPTPRIPAPSPVAAVILTPQLDTAAWIDASVHFSVSVQDSAGNPVTSGTVAWSSSDPAVAGIASDGTATARKNGVSHIVASAGGKADTATLVVRQRTSSIAVTPDSARLAAVGDTLRFAAAPTDRTGHPVAGAGLVWSVSDSGEAAIDSAGLLTARAFGRVGVTAVDTSSSVSGAAAVRITDLSPPAIDTVSPFPLLAGQPATITGQAFDASMPGDTVWIDGAPAVVTTASSTSLQITVPTYDCLPARTVVVRLATGGGVAQDSAGLMPSQSPVSLAPGHQEVIKNPADFCLQFTQGYGFKPYLVGVESLSPVGSSLTTVRFTAVAGWSSSVMLTDRVPAPPRTSVAPRTSLARRTPGGRAWARGPESRIRTWERTHLTCGSALTSRGARPASGLRPLLSVSAGVAVGDTVQVRVPDVASTDPCANYTQIGATVEAVGSHAIVVADTGNPEYGFVRGDYQKLSDALDTKVFTTDSAYFGAPSDLDGNGKAEIYICNLTATDAGSLVLEWDGAKFKEVIHGQTWLIRVVDLPGKGKVLLGQRRDPEGNYLGNVHLLKRQGNGFVSMGALNLPRFSNVFSFIQCDLSGDGSVFTIQLGPWEHLQVYNATGEKLWKSDDYFGGSLCYMDYSDPTMNRMVHTPKRLFIPSPIFTYDVNEDGKKEVVICKNNSKTGRIFGDFRWFGSGRVHFMEWDEAGLVSQFTSQKLSGTVVGYQVVDVDNDGLKELVVANVTSESYFVGLPKSRLVVYDME